MSRPRPASPPQTRCGTGTLQTDLLPFPLGHTPCVCGFASTRKITRDTLIGPHTWVVNRALSGEREAMGAFVWPSGRYGPWPCAGLAERGDTLASLTNCVHGNCNSASLPCHTHRHQNAAVSRLNARQRMPGDPEYGAPEYYGFCARPKQYQTGLGHSPLKGCTVTSNLLALSAALSNASAQTNPSAPGPAAGCGCLDLFTSHDPPSLLTLGRTASPPYLVPFRRGTRKRFSACSRARPIRVR